MNRLLTFIYFFVLNISLSHAAVTINIVESGGDVVASASGTLNIDGLGAPSVGGASGGFVNGSSGIPDIDGMIFVGATGANQDLYTIATIAGFSTGGLVLADSNTGNIVGVVSQNLNGDQIAVPDGYVSDNAISGTSTWNSTDFITLGLIPGTYAFTWGSGVTADSLTLNIGPAQPPPPPTPAATTPVPTMSAYGLVLTAMGLLIVAGHRLRTRRQA